jgi:flagellar M-ring protein FliF
MTRASSTPGGPPGLIAQGGGGGINEPASLATAGGRGNETNEETRSKQVNDSSRTLIEKETFGLTPKSAKVAVGIPASYYQKVWRERNPTKDPGDAKKPENQAAIDDIRKELLQDVRTHVATLLPSPDGKEQTANVTVTTFQDIKPAEPASPAVSQRALSWLGENWPMLAMVGLVLVSVGMLRSALRGGSAPAHETAAISARISAGETKTDAKEEAVEAVAARRLRRMTGTGPSLRDELSDLVKEDPDSAANILRTWIGQAN